MQTVAALTIYQGDIGFLKRWLGYYGDQLGRENCYVLCVGDNPMLRDLAQGCSIMRLPPDAAPTLEKRRGRIVNNLVAALLCYHAHVVVSEMDELVLVDPQARQGLRDYLIASERGQVLTPLGMQQVRHTGPETDVARRCYVRPVPELSKPCVLSTATALSRDGTLSRYGHLHMPHDLYLLRAPPFDEMSPTDAVKPDESPADQAFDFAMLRQQMQDSWARMENSRYWHFQILTQSHIYLLPQRFNDLMQSH
jgi:hypothetical protein